MSSDSSNNYSPDADFDSHDKKDCPNSGNLSLIPYWLLVVLRIALTLAPQTGYIHPDEYFQSIEVLNSDVFNVAAVRPWEFNITYPVRSVALPYAIMGAPLVLLKCLAPFLNLWFDINIVTPYTLLIIPRLACCLLSFVTDLCVYRICLIYGQNYRARLMTLASSYVMLVYGTRTFSNSVEMTLSSFLIYLVASCMSKSDLIIYQEEYLRNCYNQADNIKDRVKYHRQRLSLPWHTFSHVFYIATITVLGIFNRPTFFAFAFPPLFFWLLRGMGSQFVGIADFNARMIVLVICALPSLCIMILIDSFYYGRITLFEIIYKKINIWSDFVLTPFNFIKYNIDTDNLKNHGLHPKITHFLVNVPLLYNILGIYGLLAFLHILYRAFSRRWSSLPRIQSIFGLMTATFLIPIALLSIIPHQEPRFIIPVTLPLVFLHSQRIRRISEQSSVVSRKENGYTAFFKAKVKPDGRDGLLATWYIVNMIFTLFFGFLHQAGIYPLVNHLHKEIEAKPRLTTLHLVTSHIYPIPLSLLQIKYGAAATMISNSTRRYQKSRDVYTHELGTVGMEQVVQKIIDLQEKSEQIWKEKKLKYRLYYASPSSRSFDFRLACTDHNITVKVETIFYPHLSTEALPNGEISSVLSQLGLVLYRITPG